MISGRAKETKLKDGGELRSALASACESSLPNSFSLAQLNALLAHAAQPKDSRDPLELKHTLGTMGLAKLTLKQQKKIVEALEAQLSQARRFNLPERFDDGTPPPPPPKPDPIRKVSASKQMMLSPTPLEGRGEGFTWSQSEAELTIVIPMPEGTGKQEVHLQMTPKYGPAQQLVLRAKFWSVPLLAGILHHEVDASEAMWHLGQNGGSVVVDLPKVEEKLWPGTPPVFVRNTNPLNDITLPKLDEADEISTGGESSALVSGFTPERVVQKMCQNPLDKEVQINACIMLQQLFQANKGNCLAAANARAVPVLVKTLRSFGQETEVQIAAWRPMLSMLNSQPFLRKLVVEGGGMQMLLAGFAAHKAAADVITLLCLVMRSLLPATPPRPFVEAGGLELLAEAFLFHATNPSVGEVAAACMHMLAGINNIVRRMVLRLEVLAPLLALVEAHPDRTSLAEVTLGLMAQLGKGDATCSPFYVKQAAIRPVVDMMRRHSDMASIQADGCRVLGALLVSEEMAMDLFAAGGLELLLEAERSHSDVPAVTNEVANVLEQAICVMCEAVGEEAPEEELDTLGMANVLRDMDAAAVGRRKAEAEERARVEEEKRIAAEKEEAERLAAIAALEAQRQAEIEDARNDTSPSAYGGFTWKGSSFDDPRLAALEDEPRIVELDDD